MEPFSEEAGEFNDRLFVRAASDSERLLLTTSVNLLVRSFAQASTSGRVGRGEWLDILKCERKGMRCEVMADVLPD